MGETRPSTGNNNPEYRADILTGEVLLGKVAVNSHIEAGGHPLDIFPLDDVLVDRSIPLPEVQVRSNSTKDKVLEDAAFLTRLIGRGNSARALRLRIVRRAHSLGLIASDHYLARPDMFGSLRGLHRTMGLEDIDKRYRFSHYELDDILDHLENVIEEEGQKPTREILWRRIREDKRDEITPKAIDRVIHLSSALELIGYTNVRAWQTNSEFEQWGVDYCLANGLRLPNRVVMEQLSKVGRGPSSSIISSRFGRINTFKQSVKVEIEHRVADIETGLREGSIHPRLFLGSKTFTEILKRYATYGLVSEILPQIDERDKVALSSGADKAANFVEALQCYDDSITTKELEVSARRHGCFYYIFPRVDYLKSLRYPYSSRQNKPRKDLIRLRKRLLNNLQRRRKNFFIGETYVYELVSLEDGFYLNRLEPEASDVPLPRDSSVAKDIIGKIRKEKGSKKWRRKPIDGTAGVGVYRQQEQL